MSGELKSREEMDASHRLAYDMGRVEAETQLALAEERLAVYAQEIADRSEAITELEERERELREALEYLRDSAGRTPQNGCFVTGEFLDDLLARSEGEE